MTRSVELLRHDNSELLPLIELDLPGQRDDHALAFLEMCGLGGLSDGRDPDLTDTSTLRHLKR